MIHLILFIIYQNKIPEAQDEHVQSDSMEKGTPLLYNKYYKRSITMCQLFK